MIKLPEPYPIVINGKFYKFDKLEVFLTFYNDIEYYVLAFFDLNSNKLIQLTIPKQSLPNDLIKLIDENF